MNSIHSFELQKRLKGMRVKGVTEHCQMSSSGSSRCKAGDKRLDAVLATCGVA